MSVLILLICRLPIWGATYRKSREDSELAGFKYLPDVILSTLIVIIWIMISRYVYYNTSTERSFGFFMAFVEVMFISFVLMLLL